MTVAEAWASIDGGPLVGAVLQAGDRWWFPVPGGMTGCFFVEIWATDEAGNQSYAAAHFEMEAGAIKCIRWLRDTGMCLMLPRPHAVAESVQRPDVSMLPFVGVRMEPFRPVVSVLPHVCMCSEV